MTVLFVYCNYAVILKLLCTDVEITHINLLRTGQNNPLSTTKINTLSPHWVTIRIFRSLAQEHFNYNNLEIWDCTVSHGVSTQAHHSHVRLTSFWMLWWCFQSDSGVILGAFIIGLCVRLCILSASVRGKVLSPCFSIRKQMARFIYSLSVFDCLHVARVAISSIKEVLKCDRSRVGRSECVQCILYFHIFFCVWVGVNGCIRERSQYCRHSH